MGTLYPVAADVCTAQEDQGSQDLSYIHSLTYIVVHPQYLKKKVI